MLEFKGGEGAALARLKYYLWDSGLISTYFDTRNGMIGAWQACRALAVPSVCRHTGYQKAATTNSGGDSSGSDADSSTTQQNPHKG